MFTFLFSQRTAAQDRARRGTAVRKISNHRCRIEPLQRREMLSAGAAPVAIAPPALTAPLDSAPALVETTPLTLSSGTHASPALARNEVAAQSFPVSQTMLHFKSNTTYTLRNVTIDIDCNGQHYRTLMYKQLRPWEDIYLTGMPLGTYTFKATGNVAGSNISMQAAGSMRLTNGNRHGNSDLLWRKVSGRAIQANGEGLERNSQDRTSAVRESCGKAATSVAVQESNRYDNRSPVVAYGRKSVDDGLARTAGRVFENLLEDWREAKLL